MLNEKLRYVAAIMAVISLSHTVLTSELQTVARKPKLRSVEKIPPRDIISSELRRSTSTKQIEERFGPAQWSEAKVATYDAPVSAIYVPLKQSSKSNSAYLVQYLKGRELLPNPMVLKIGKARGAKGERQISFHTAEGTRYFSAQLEGNRIHNPKLSAGTSVYGPCVEACLKEQLTSWYAVLTCGTSLPACLITFEIYCRGKCGLSD